jgi:hypothetical protein
MKNFFMIVDFFGYGAAAHVLTRPPRFRGYWITLRHMKTRQVSFEQIVKSLQKPLPT